MVHGTAKRDVIQSKRTCHTTAQRWLLYVVAPDIHSWVHPSLDNNYTTTIAGGTPTFLVPKRASMRNIPIPIWIELARARGSGGNRNRAAALEDHSQLSVERISSKQARWPLKAVVLVLTRLSMISSSLQSRLEGQIIGTCLTVWLYRNLYVSIPSICSYKRIYTFGWFLACIDLTLKNLKK